MKRKITINPTLHLLLSFLAAFAIAPKTLHAQAPLEMQLNISPNISAFPADWEIDPESVTLFVFNFGQEPVTAILQAELFNGAGALVARTIPTQTFPITIPPGEQLFFPQDIFPYSAVQVAPAYQEQLGLSGRLPEDNYQLCIMLLSPSGGPLTPPSCGSFFIQGYEPPQLLMPHNGEHIPSDAAANILFQWTPLIPEPPFPVLYVFQLAEVLEGQPPQEAIRVNPPLFTAELFNETQFPFSFEMTGIAQPWLETGSAAYVWTVTAVGETGQSLTDQPTLPSTFTVTGPGGECACTHCTFNGFSIYKNGALVTLHGQEPWVVGETLSFKPSFLTDCPDGCPLVIRGNFHVQIINAFSGEVLTDTMVAQTDELVFQPRRSGIVVIRFDGAAFCGESICPCEGVFQKEYAAVPRTTSGDVVQPGDAADPIPGVGDPTTPTTPVPGTDDPPGVGDPTVPIDSFPVPPPEDPPRIPVVETCMMPPPARDPATPVSLGMLFHDGEESIFKYPRAIPIRAEGIDFDRARFFCEGCEDGSFEEKIFRDEVGDFRWQLIGKGSLDIPIDAQRIQALNDHIKALVDSLAAVEARIRAKQAELDAAPDKIKEEKDLAREKLREVERRLHELDSLLGAGRDSTAALDDLIARTVQTIGNLLERNKALRNRMDVLQDSIDAMTARLAGELTPEEKFLLDAVAVARQQAQLADSLVRLKQEEIIDQARQLQQAIVDAETLLSQVTANYNQLKEQAEVLTRLIGELETQRFRRHGQSGQNYYQNQNQWRHMTNDFLEVYFPEGSLPDSLHQEIFLWRDSVEYWSALAFSTQNTTLRNIRLQFFNMAMDSLEAHLVEGCLSLPDTTMRDFCLDAATVWQTSSGDYQSAAGQAGQSEFTLDLRVQDQIDSLKVILRSLEASIAAAAQTVEGQSRNYENAFENYVATMSLLEDEKIGLQHAAQEKNADLAQKESDFQSLHNALKQDLKENYQSYVQQLQDQKSERAAAVTEVERNLDSLFSLHRDTLMYRAAKAAMLEQIRKDSTEEVRLEALKGNLERILARDSAEIIQKLKDELEELNRRKEELEAELENLKTEQAKIMAGNKTGSGPVVYYIPPPLEEIMKDKARFEELKLKVEQAEARLELAYARKGELQAFLTKQLEKIARELVKYKQSEDREEQLSEKIEELKRKLASLANDRMLENQGTQSRLQEILANAEEALQKAEDWIDKYEQDSARLETELENLRNEAKDQQELADGYPQEESAQLKYHENLIENLKQTISARTEELQQAKAALREMEDALGRLQARLNRATALDSVQEIRSIQAEIQSAKSDINLQEQKIANLEAGLQSADAGMKSRMATLEAARQSLDNAEKAARIANRYADSLWVEVEKLNFEYRKVLEELVFWRMVKGKAERLINKTDKARKDFSEIAGEEIDQDEQVAAMQAAIDDAEKAEKDAEKAKNNSASEVETIRQAMKDAEEEAKERLEAAKDSLEQAKQELRDFLLEELETVQLQVQIILKGRDLVLDAWRTGDGEQQLNNTLIYPGKRTPQWRTIRANDAAPVPNLDPGACQVMLSFDPGPGPSVSPPLPGKEPRTIALVYKDGEPIWPEWPVIPQSAPLLAKDVIPLYVSENDADLRIQDCIPAADCKGNPHAEDIIADMGAFVWNGEMRFIDPKPLLPYVLAEPRKVPVSLCEKEQETRVEFMPAEIAGDQPARNLNKPIVKAGVLIEVPDSLQGAPESEVDVTARVVVGDHTGLAGENILYRVKLIAGEAIDYGFDGGQKQVVKKTDGNGYTRPKFNFGKGFAEFEIVVKWFRTDTCEEKTIRAISPLYLDFIKLGGGPPTFAWEGAKKAWEGASAASATEDFPSSLGEEGKEAYARTVHGIAGLLDFEQDFVNDDSLVYTVLTDGIEIDPEQGLTELFGILRTVVLNPPEENEREDESKMDITLKVRSREVYRPVCFPPEDEETYNGSKLQKFKIGVKGEEFVIITDEPFSQGETVTGGGRIELNADVDGMLMIKLAEISLKVNEVETEDGGDPEAPRAVAGSVAWTGEGGVGIELVGFEFTIDSIVIAAELGAGIGGAVNPKMMNLPRPVSFYAELSLNGDFYGELSDLPEIKVADFTLKQGTALILDMHSGKNPALMPQSKSFKGIVISSMELEFPEIFSSSETDQRTTLSVRDFYIDDAGLNGKIGLEGEGFGIGFKGFNFQVNALEVEFKEGDLAAGAIGCAVDLPSPMEGGINAQIGWEKAVGWNISFTTDNPVSIPKLGLVFSLREETGLTYNTQSGVGTLRLNATITSEKTGEIEINGFEINSNGEVMAESIRLNKDIQFSGFSLHVDEISFAFTEQQTRVSLRGGFSFASIGINELKGTAWIEAGPKAGVALEEGEIEFEKGPVSFLGKFAFTASEFRGEFEIGLMTKAKKGGGIRGLIIVGNFQGDDQQAAFTYWYAEMELTLPQGIPLGQSGISILGLGGGVGYNYDPPIGDQAGAPRNTDAFSLKASVTLGNTPSGELIAGRVTMVLVSGRFSLNGKIWLLKQEENMFGEGQLNVIWEPENKVNGYVRMFIGLPDAEGKVVRFNGKINFAFPADPHYVWSEEIKGSVLGLLEAEASFIFGEEFVSFDGKLSFGLNKEFGFDALKLAVDLNVGAQASLNYKIREKELDASVSFNGYYSVNLLVNVNVLIGTIEESFNILSGNLPRLDARLTANPSKVKMEATLTVSWDIWVSSGTKELSVGFEI
jgi:chromosome segregation ATPase